MSDPNHDSISRRLLEHREHLLSYIMAIVRDYNTAEDLFQEVALIILQKEKQGITVRDFGPWSREIARRKTLNFFKQCGKKNRRILSVESMVAVEKAFARQSFPEESRVPELINRLKKCLLELPRHLRRLIHLRFAEKHTFKEISNILNTTPGAAQVKLSRIRQKLFECIRRLQDS